MSTFKKRLLILIGIFIILLFIFIFSSMINKSSNIPPETTPLSPTTGTIPVIPTISDIPVTFTGQKDDELPKEKAEEINKSFELRQKVPLETESFLLDYNYANGTFILSIKPPFDTNSEVFNSWMKDNGYEVIPVDQFVVKSI